MKTEEYDLLMYYYVEQNKTKKEIASILKTTEREIYNKLKRYKITKREVQRKRSILEKYSIDEIKEYFRHHTREETAKHFGISLQNMKELMRIYDFHHTTEEKVELRRKSCLDKYGVTCVFMTKENIEKSHSNETIEKMMNTQVKNNLAKYGVMYTWQIPQVISKINDTNTLKYGGKNWTTTDEGKAKMSEIHKSRELQEKTNRTKKERGTFNSSSKEKELHSLLVCIFGEDDVDTQFRDSTRYPFACDFYIKSKDLFIELNAHWTHGKFPFDKNNDKCIQILEKWKNRESTSKFYANAIHVWTMRDVEKFKNVVANEINFIALYNESTYFYGNELLVMDVLKKLDMGADKVYKLKSQ